MKYKHSLKRRQQWRKYYHRHHKKRLAYNHKYYKENKEKIVKRQKKYYQKHKQRMLYQVWERNLKRKYGLTIKEYNDMLKQQSKVCAICNNPNKNERLHVDHCHKTQKIRGLLCRTCNRILGLTQDNVNLLQKFIDYLGEF